MTPATEERQLRRALHGTLQSVSPPPVPLEAIARRGKVIRLRRAGAAAGALALAGIVAVRRRLAPTARVVCPWPVRSSARIT